MNVQRIPNPTTAMTVSHMVELAREGAKQIPIRLTAEEIVRNVRPRDYVSEGQAVSKWVERNIRYTKDPAEVEFLRAPARLLEARLGDCDELATLIAALLLALGHHCEFVTASYRDGGEPSHVFVQMVLRTGRRAVLDPVAQPDVPGMLRRVRRYWVYPVA